MTLETAAARFKANLEAAEADRFEFPATAAAPGRHLVGNNGPNLIRGGANDNLIHGQGGDDRLFGGGGNDRMYGEDGRDYLDGGPGKDRVYGGPGNDVIQAGAGDTVILGDGRDILRMPGAGKVAIAYGANANPFDPSSDHIVWWQNDLNVRLTAAKWKDVGGGDVTLHQATFSDGKATLVANFYGAAGSADYLTFDSPLGNARLYADFFADWIV